METACKWANQPYCVPDVDDVPLILRGLTDTDVGLLRPFEIHCGDYARHFNGYRQLTGPFRPFIDGQPTAPTPSLSACSKVALASRSCIRSLQLLIMRASSALSGPTSTIRPACESVLRGQENRASCKISYTNKLFSPVVDYCLDFELLQFQYDRWLFKTITINSAKASRCSPNTSLQDKSFSATYWRWQHMYLIDAVCHKTSLQFQYTERDAEHNIRAYTTTLLGALRCHTDVQVADVKATLLKYVSSYVTKMHEVATSEGLYSSDITGYQAAHSFLRTVVPLEPEMVMQLSNIKVCWTDKLTQQLVAPFPGFHTCVPIRKDRALRADASKAFSQSRALRPERYANDKLIEAIESEQPLDEIEELADSLVDRSELSKIKRSVNEKLNPEGHSYDAVMAYKERVSQVLEDLFLIYKVDCE
ncbi:hypothetical protein ACROYT_G013841 [Oculina patagonica]